MNERRRARVHGLVQGVGFRPFVASLARTYALAGLVRNEGDSVVVEVEGPTSVLDAFASKLAAPPAPARVDSVAWIRVPRDEPCDPPRDVPPHDARFEITESLDAGARALVSPPDLAPCAECLTELRDPHARRFGYPFTSCARCGPRASITLTLPFDRERTTLAAFAPCAACEAEYRDPLDRRHHAQTLCCAACGPRVILRDARGEEVAHEDPIEAALEALDRGALVALRGVGGWQLLCDARDVSAVQRLRDRKRRPTRPFAVLVASLERARTLAYLNDDEDRALTSRGAPIVLVRPRAGLASSVAPNVAPAVPRLGVMLPASPLHQRLADAFARHDGVLVCTSANEQGEPTPIADEAFASLRGVADLFVDHDRPIARRLDDSVLHVAAGRARALRVGRGMAPLALPFASPTAMLATGAHQQNAPGACSTTHAFLAAHVGDLDGLDARRAHRVASDDLLGFFGLEPRLVVTDAHPDLACSLAAEARALPIERVWHHHAHVAAVLAEHDATHALGFAFDGFGLTPEGAGGGEVIDVGPTGARWRARLHPLAIVGLDRAAREGRRALAGMLASSGADVAAFVPELAPAMRHAVATPSVGRLFDAVAAALGICVRSTWEGEAACSLEAVALPDQAPYPFAVTHDLLDWRPMVAPLLADRADPPRAAGRFHATLAAMIATYAAGRSTVVLAGGCFQNVLLLERTLEQLEARGVRALVAERLPPGDGGLALGQLRVAAWRASSPRA